MASSFFLLLDDIASVLDDVATMTKVAAKKTAGVLASIAAIMTVGVDGLVAAIVRLDDAGLALIRRDRAVARGLGREIRRHSQNTMARLQLLYERLGEATGTRLDTRSLSVIVSHQVFSILNYYVGLSKRERATARPVLLRATVQLMVGGVLAVRLPESETAAAVVRSEDATDGE